MTTPTIQQTLAFIQFAHGEQVDKGGEPYWKHPLAVMRLLGDDAPEHDKHVALLHDVIEDTSYTAEDLLGMGYPPAVVEDVVALSRPPLLTYMEWIRAIAASGNQTVIRVKLADNKHNSDPERNARLPEAERGITARYARSMVILREALSK